MQHNITQLPHTSESPVLPDGFADITHVAKDEAWPPIDLAAMLGNRLPPPLFPVALFTC
jgi:hypothetical protein